MRKLNPIHKIATKTAFDEAGVMKKYLKGFSPLVSDSKQSSPGKSRSVSSRFAELGKSVKNLFRKRGGKKSRKNVKNREGRRRTTRN